MQQLSPDDFNPYSPEFLENPFPTYAWFRENQPVHRFYDQHDQFESFWVFGHTDIEQALCNKCLWGKENPAESLLESMLTKSLFASDEGHAEKRAVLEPMFHRALSRLESELPEVAYDMARAVRRERRFDVVEDFSRPLAEKMLATMLGVSSIEWRLISRLVTKILLASNPANDQKVISDGKSAMIKLRAMYLALIETAPFRFEEGGMIDLMIKHSNDNPEFTSGDVCANATSMSVAGAFSTVFLLSTGMSRLFQDPALMQSVKQAVSGPDNTMALRSLAGELLRLESPVQILQRYAGVATEIGGVEIPADSKIKLILGSGNRDSRVFANADALDLNRDLTATLSFGHGVHRCLGNPMFALVAPEALRILLTELPETEQTGDPIWQTDPALRGISELEVMQSSGGLVQRR